MNSLGDKPRKSSSLASLEFIFILLFPESKVEGNKKEGKDSLSGEALQDREHFLGLRPRKLSP